MAGCGVSAGQIRNNRKTGKGRSYFAEGPNPMGASSGFRGNASARLCAFFGPFIQEIEFLLI